MDTILIFLSTIDNTKLIILGGFIVLVIMPMILAIKPQFRENLNFLIQKLLKNINKKEKK
ncbi:BlyA family holin [Borreliella burgdorferi]|uniref:BlyA family holin n=1 Tax=Borreliella burgdorferi TaxID=139 RepID=UPI0003FF152F|nr:BlyA family holin [Borreliella burgdorferi]QXG44818.1 BlyA family holin [Borreliella burgdorferi]WKC95847.1 BlyA family holin [Borreliella burgdorferi]WKC96762.1 BlyA family holin [Borreliella burgdorferi]WNY57980.1 BlyA family holin [Borreliella burgdorferi]WNY59839.1 BlyA family holin [Borreliella burgdorferi]